MPQMSEQEAIEVLKIWIADWEYLLNLIAKCNDKRIENAKIKMELYALNLAVSALEKQIAKPSYNTRNARNLKVDKCTVCDNTLDYIELINFCPNCGQKLKEE